MSSPSESLSLTAMLASIDASAAAMEARLIRWSELNSGGRNTAGLLQMASLVGTELLRLGADVEHVPLPEAEAPAFRARRRPNAPVQVLLSGHLDTVYGESDEFQSCSRLDDDTLCGPGVADMKGGLVVMLEALRALESSPGTERIGWEVLLTPDEETGSRASTPLLREAAARNHLGIVFEAALPGGQIVRSRNGIGSVQVTARGRAAHAGRDFSHGRNAIVALANLISAVHFINGAIPDVVVNAGSVAGGGTINIVPARALAEFNVRAARLADGDEVLRRIRDAAAAIGRATEVEFDVVGGFTRMPMEETPATAGLLEAWCAGARALGMDLKAGHSASGSEGNILAAAGLPCVDGAGVEGGDLHSSREWMRLSSLPRRAKIAAQFLRRLAAGEITLPGPRP